MKSSGVSAAPSGDAVAILVTPASRWRRLLARVGGWQAPPRNLLLSALVLLVFPWDDIFIDALYSGHPKLPTLVVYGVWTLFDFSVIWVLLASGRLVRPAFVFGAITVALDAMQALVYLGLTQYTTAYTVASLALSAGYVGLITTVMWVRLREPGRQPPLFTFVVPLLVSIAVAYAATFCAAVTCGHGARHACGAYGPPIGHSFFDVAAHIIAILLVALAIEARLLVDRSGPEERALMGVTMLGLAVGIAASLTAAAADSGTVPLVFPLTVQALAIGVTTTLMLPFLRVAPSVAADRATGQRSGGAAATNAANAREAGER